MENDYRRIVVEAMFPSAFDKALGDAVRIKSNCDAFDHQMLAYQQNAAFKTLSFSDWKDVIDSAAKRCF